jgi:acyl carrier protein
MGMPTMDERMAEVFREVFQDDELVVQEWMTAGDIPGWDSLALVKLVIALEEEFGVGLSTHDVAQVASVSDLKRALRRTGAVD